MLSREEYKRIGDMPIVGMTANDVVKYFDQIVEMIDEGFIDSKKEVTFALTAAKSEFLCECMHESDKQDQLVDFNKQSKAAGEVVAKAEAEAEAKQALKSEPEMTHTQRLILVIIVLLNTPLLFKKVMTSLHAPAQRNCGIV